MLKPFLGSWVISCSLLLNVQATSLPDPIATVNGKPITKQELDDYISKQGNSPNASPQVILEGLINRELVKQSVLDQKLDKTPEFANMLEELRGNLLVETGIRAYLTKHPLDDATLKQEYDKRNTVATLPKEYKVRHILVKSEEEAKDLIAQLEKGQSFAELAKGKSTDTVSAKEGGELGWVNREKVVPEFADAMEKMTKGESSKVPVKSQFGWHVLQVEDVRTVELPPFETLKDHLKMSLQNQQVQNYVDELRKQAKIEVLMKDEKTSLPPQLPAR